jgi:hypothetical protein
MFETVAMHLAALETALACPRCAAGQAARQRLFEEDPLPKLLISALPFLLVGLVSAWADRLGKSKHSRG